MNISSHIGPVLGSFPFIVVLPAAVAAVCNRVPATKRHPALVYPFCVALSFLIAYFFSKFAAFKLHGIDLVGAGVLSALCFAFAYLRATDILTKERWALIWREIFLVSFAAGNLYLAWTDWKSWGYIVITVLCGASAVLLWRSSPRAKYPLFAVTLFLGGNALIFGIYNYIRQPELLHSSLESQIIGWLIPGVPTALLVSCCLYARQVGLHRRTK